MFALLFLALTASSHADIYDRNLVLCTGPDRVDTCRRVEPNDHALNLVTREASENYSESEKLRRVITWEVLMLQAWKHEDQLGEWTRCVQAHIDSRLESVIDGEDLCGSL